MPFFRRRPFRRRFSATPRRPFRRRRVGEQEGRLQKAQLFDTFEVISDLDSIVTPGFIHVLLTPWDNAPPGGYDRSWEVKGIVWQMHMHYSGALRGQGLTRDFLPTADLNATNSVLPVSSALWVDAAETDGQPRSSVSYNPFITTPPVITGGAGFDDDETFPTRVLASKTGAVSLGNPPNSRSGLQNPGYFTWSGRVSRRISIANRQGLFVSGFVGQPQVPVNDVSELRCFWQVWVKYFYRLAR